jgi:hypothetical protein
LYTNCPENLGGRLLQMVKIWVTPRVCRTDRL